ncbi:hypothetical protein [Rhizobium ruizarguesonis]|uniref:hypothetical protein n=1 Tax=Rhizobium ruizarguesonis TaxID=2081791 RepID=UPI00102F534B|nr:hypothetical protein [Rhizobium ruizarguesonis]TBA29368.1 hypothetical protein ELH63_37120 [Rhizobium ruizarguesonis]TBA30322.1 hypothetical protein ELH62_37990 [Rhizobium ruizarguesonis]
METKDVVTMSLSASAFALGVFNLYRSMRSDRRALGMSFAIKKQEALTLILKAKTRERSIRLKLDTIRKTAAARGNEDVLKSIADLIGKSSQHMRTLEAASNAITGFSIKRASHRDIETFVEKHITGLMAATTDEREGKIDQFVRHSAAVLGENGPEARDLSASKKPQTL